MAVEKANKFGAEIQRELANLGVRVIGDVDSLGNAKVPTGSSPYTDSIDIKTVASAMMVFDRNSINRMPVSG